ncbi:MAG: hypothetical protein QOC85_1820, partial [Streptomyces sp.]|nr:hypothetical protein [Streptomyces sp.]
MSTGDGIPWAAEADAQPDDT